MVDADDVRACRDVCVAFLRSVIDRDWSSSIPEMDMDVGTVVAHITQANLWYAYDLAAGGIDADAYEPLVKTNAEPDALIAAFTTAANVLAAVIAAAADDARGFHPFGQADRSGFAAMACDEMIVHTHDVSRGLGVDFAPPGDMAARVLGRLFPWATSVDDDAWNALQWANGRIAIADRPRLTKWRWHCAPLDEWDGLEPTPPAP